MSIDRNCAKKIFIDSNNIFIATIPSEEEFIQIEKFFEERMSLCTKCDHFVPFQSICKQCGCSMLFKCQNIYPVDENNKSIRWIDKTGKTVYVCKLKKW